jgi:hypothetical protein
LRTLQYAKFIKFGIIDKNKDPDLAAHTNELLYDSRLILIDKSLLNFEVSGRGLPIDISSPFEKVFIENANGDRLFVCMIGQEVFEINAILCQEENGVRYNIFALSVGRTFSFSSDQYPKDTLSALIYDGVENVFRALNNRQTLVGEASVNHRFERQGLSPHRVRRIVVFKDKNKKSESPEEVMGREVDWKHTWEVMGHWRKTAFVGKDRDGNYWVKGRTWVKPCVKGNGDLIVKTRLMKKHQESVKI